jgi:hypothetical protein
MPLTTARCSFITDEVCTGHGWRRLLKPTISLQETPKFSWAGLFSSAGPRKYNVIFVGNSDRRKWVLFSSANEAFRRQAHENTKGIFVGLGTDENV